MPIRDTIQDTASQVIKFVSECEASKAEDGLKSCWQSSMSISVRYMAYRWVQFVVHYLILLGAVLELYTMGVKTHPVMYYGKWLLYLTSWVLVMNVVQALFGAVLVTLAYRHSARSDVAEGSYGVTKQAIAVYRAFYCIALNLTVFMVAGYWHLEGIFPKVAASDRLMFAGYGASVVFMLADLFVIAFPYTMRTGVCSLGMMVLYLLVTYLHGFTGSLDAYQKKKYIYPGLDWSKPKPSALSALVCLTLLGILNCSVLWWLCQLRRYIVHAYNNRGASQPTAIQRPPSPPPPSQPPADQTPADPTPNPPMDNTMQPTTNNTPMKNEPNEPHMEKPKKKKSK